MSILRIFGILPFAVYNTNYMQLSPSREASSFVATQELPNILRNSKVDYRAYKNTPLFPTLNRTEPIQSIPSHSTSPRSSLLLFSYLRLGLPIDLLPSGYPTNNLHAILFSPFEVHVLPILSSFSWFFQLYLGRVQIMVLLIMQFSLSSCHFISPFFKCSPQHPVLKHP
jgi:hypothetical protein